MFKSFLSEADTIENFSLGAHQMTAFTRDTSEWQRLDWQLLLNGGVVLCFKESVLLEDVDWLQENGYLIYEFFCDQWTSVAVMHADFQDKLHFPEYYGKNLDALDDCLPDIEPPERGGVAVVLHRFDSFAKSAGAIRYPSAMRTVAEFVLDSMASTSRYQMLTGSRFLCMVQSDDPEIQFQQLGCVDAMWNPREWLNKNRGL